MTLTPLVYIRPKVCGGNLCLTAHRRGNKTYHATNIYSAMFLTERLNFSGSSYQKQSVVRRCTKKYTHTFTALSGMYGVMRVQS